jgi:DNA-binding beta-propeller fold protein YncE
MKRLALLTVGILCLGFAPQAFCQKLLKAIDIGGQGGPPAVNTVTDMIYIPNTTLGTLTVISGATGTVVTNVPIGSVPIAAAVNTSSNLIYATNGSTVTVIDGSSNTIVTTVPVGTANYVSVNPTTNLIYVTGGSGVSAISVLDGATNQIISTINLGLSCCTVGIAVDANLNRIYCTVDLLGGSPQFVLIDGATNKVTVLPLTGVLNAGPPVLDGTLGRVYVADNAGGGLYIVNSHTGNIITSILPGYTGPVAVNPTNHEIADFDFLAGVTELFFVNPKTFSFIGGEVSFPSQQSPVHMAASGNNRFYVTFFKNQKNIDFVAVVSGP